MAGRVFDDNGGVWSSTSTEFSTTFATQGTGMSSGDYAVSALGFVVVDLFGQTAQVRLAPAIVSANALVTATDWLKGQRFERISIAYWDQNWRYDFAGSLDEALAKIAEKISNTARIALEPVMWRKTDRSDVARSPILSAMFREWREIVGAGAQVDPVHFANRHLQNRYVVARRRPEIGALVFDAIGTGFRYYGEQWAESSLGKPLKSQPDPVYGAWVSESYDQAQYLGEPSAHDVDAVIKPQKGTMARLRIRRVVLPLPAEGGDSVVIGGSFYDDSVDLRQVAEVADNENETLDFKQRLNAAYRRITIGLSG